MLNNHYSNTLRFIGIIPARYASTRFSGKPLVDIGGKMMIQRVYEQVSAVLNEVYVATDDERILKVVESFGGKAVMTSENHKSGTDRCYEAYLNINKPFDIIINIQGDEPFIQPEQIHTIQECFFSDSETEIATLAKPITVEHSFDYLFNPNHPKIIIDKHNYAIYFSRSVIPYVRGKEHTKWIESHQYYQHVGVYAYRIETLKKITSLEQTPLEIAESLEQLRWIENGLRIKVGYTDIESIGIDTPEDLEKALKYFI